MMATTEHFNRLTEAEAERLALLIEECAEVQKAATKILRHGYESHNPHAKTPAEEDAETNRQSLTRDCADLSHVIGRLIKAGNIEGLEVAMHASRKASTIKTWLHHQETQ